MKVKTTNYLKKKITESHTSPKSNVKHKNKKKRKSKYSNPKIQFQIDCNEEKIEHFLLTPSTSETDTVDRRSISRNNSIGVEIVNLRKDDRSTDQSMLCDLSFEEDKSPVIDTETKKCYSCKPILYQSIECDNSANNSILEEESNDEEIESKEIYNQVLDKDSFDSVQECPNEKNSNLFSDYEEKFDLYKIDSKYIIVLKYSQDISIFGYCNIQVLYGTVDILGYTITVSSPKQTIYSPRGSSLLTIRNSSQFCHYLEHIKSLVPPLEKQDIIFDSLKVRKDCCIFILSAAFDVKMNLIESHISQKISPCKIQLEPCVDIEPKGQWNKISICEEWSQIAEEVSSSTRLFICGGRGVGKSTFMRFLINRALQKFKKVKVVDLDPGQSEFTPPGTVSVVTVNEPLFGVNYTHLKRADRSILCDINVSSNPHKYIQCIQELIKNFHNPGNLPVLINYMGYTSDIAFHLVSSAIAVIQPTEVIYICSTNKKRNFKIAMNHSTIKRDCKLFCSNLDVNFEDVKITQITSVTDDNKGWTLEARQMREMCILAYFAGWLEEPVHSLQSYKLPMFELNLSDISVTDKNNVTVGVEVLTASMVALCAIVNESAAIFQCFGWGIVRGVNPTKKFLIIFTPVEENLLEKVTHVVAGVVSLPPAVYMNHENVQGHVPYVMEGELVDFAQMSKRTHIPNNNSKGGI